jgi:hypothetical protein
LFHRVTDRVQDNRDLVLFKKKIVIWPSGPSPLWQKDHASRVTVTGSQPRRDTVPTANSLAGGATERMEPASSSPAAPPRQGKETNRPMNVQGATEMGGVREDEFASKIVGNDPTNVSSLFDHAATRVTTGLAVHSEEMVDQSNK